MTIPVLGADPAMVTSSNAQDVGANRAQHMPRPEPVKPACKSCDEIRKILINDWNKEKTPRYEMALQAIREISASNDQFDFKTIVKICDVALKSKEDLLK